LGRARGRVYLGLWGSPEATQEYARIVARIAAADTAGRNDSPREIGVGASNVADLTINELVAHYLTTHVADYYTKNGEPTSEQANIRRAVGVVSRMYGDVVANEFGPSSLKSVRESMVSLGRVRNSINKMLNASDACSNGRLKTS
jgi:hypothetical protein